LCRPKLEAAHSRERQPEQSREQERAREALILGFFELQASNLLSRFTDHSPFFKQGHAGQVFPAALVHELKRDHFKCGSKHGAAFLPQTLFHCRIDGISQLSSASSRLPMFSGELEKAEETANLGR
jgi:hypothetical protein